MYTKHRVWFAYLIFLVGLLLSIYSVLASYNVHIIGTKSLVIIVYSSDCDNCMNSVERINALLKKLGGFEIKTCIANSGNFCKAFLQFISEIDTITFVEPVAVVYIINDGVRGIVFNPIDAPSFWEMLRDTEPSENYISIYYRTDFYGLIPIEKCLVDIFYFLSKSVDNGIANITLDNCKPNDIAVIGH